MPLIGVGACVSLQFATLESAKRYFINSNTHSNNSSPSTLTPAQLYLSGAFSGLTNSILSGPIEHIRTRLQIQTKVITYTGPLDFLKKVYSAHGIRGVYKGQGITLVREFHGYGVYFATYEALMQQTMMEMNVSRNEVGVGRQMVFGALSGYALWFMIYPIDAIKSTSF
jgi:solute carrier family 25 carnitine/acylcarnitine transporter 20/29